jgi:hypothetical protein
MSFETAGGRSQPGSKDPAGDRVKKAVKPGLRRKLGRWAQQTYQIGQRRAARLMKVGWSTWLYRRKVRRFEEVLRRRLCEMAATYVRYGYRRLTVMLRREGWKVNAKRIYRLYAEEQLIVRNKRFIRPGRPVENAFIESFNGRLRDECLNVEWFSSLEDARQKLAKFREHYNHQRPHSALADRTPAAFAELHRLGKEKASTSREARTPEPLYRVSGVRETRVESG